MKICVIISTYNNPEWLEKTLWGFRLQTVLPDEIIVADDGSDSRTAQLIERYSGELPLRHVWHEDKGFRKTKILNKALSETDADYIIFTDQDCVPRQDFVEAHKQHARKGYFLSGGYVKLPMSISKELTFEDIYSERAFSVDWLRKRGFKISKKYLKLISNRTFAWIMNHITPTRRTWNGMNSSGWREDLINVNGFDERMEYGGEDRELGERLMNGGLRGRQIRYSAVLLHLDHDRPYVNAQSWAKNKAIREATRKNKIVKTQYGLNEIKK